MTDATKSELPKLEYDVSYSKIDVIEMIAAGDVETRANGNFPSFHHIYDHDGLDTRHVQCIACGKVLANKTRGGQFKRHVRSTCRRREILQSPAPMIATDYEKLRRAITEYVLVSATPFQRIEKEPFVNLIVRIANTWNIDLDRTRLPKRKTVTEDVQTAVTSMLMRAADEARNFVDQGLSAICLDGGRDHQSDFLSVYVVYIDVDAGYTTKCCPIGLRYCNAVKKDAATIKSYVDEIFEKIGWPTDFLSKMFCIADGAHAMKRFGEIFCRAYVRCSSHALHLVGHHTVNPYHKTMSRLIPREKELLKEAQKLFEDADKLVSVFRNNREVSSRLQKLPVKAAPTRWLSVRNSLTDLLDSIPTAYSVLHLLPTEQQRLLQDVGKNIEVLQFLVDILAFLEKPIIRLQASNTITLNLVPSVFKELVDRLEDIMSKVAVTHADSDNVELLHLIAKLALEATMRQQSETVQGVHLAADFLSPRLRTVHKLSDDERDSAIACLKKIDSTILSAKELPNEDPVHAQDDFISSFFTLSAPSNHSSVPNLIDEIVRFESLTSNLDANIFWLRHRETFPRLFLVSRVIFSIPASETASERMFSRCVRIAGNPFLMRT
ncbi:unnamed protein product [Caenorhabditis auriculariae]|uniref:HAT C-terminal dimerisation domain-containing protein n=1 Tax=Caenorhabditis auriculariae TaxID=2777116 RepID=A0A8S1HQJ9_9PELO|nr:unnamed protein product [Caenorhabditis auriculariae]